VPRAWIEVDPAQRLAYALGERRYGPHIGVPRGGRNVCGMLPRNGPGFKGVWRSSLRPMRWAASCMSHKVRILALARAILVTVMGLVHQNGPLDIKCLISFCVRTMANGVDAPDERTPKISAAHFCMTSDKSEHSTPGRRSEWAVRDHSRSTARVNSAFLSAAWGPSMQKGPVIGPPSGPL
jgi:hypothetical protein